MQLSYPVARINRLPIFLDNEPGRTSRETDIFPFLNLLIDASSYFLRHEALGKIAGRLAGASRRTPWKDKRGLSGDFKAQFIGMPKRRS
jgi:hypothetical protein